MKPTQTKPSIVFCHGIWADGSCFNKLIPTLQAEGHDVIAVQYGLDSQAADVAATKRTLGRVSSPAILVGHSYGGAVITAAGTDDRVVGLVYIAAVAPDAGETVQSQLNKYPTPIFGHIEVADGLRSRSRRLSRPPTSPPTRTCSTRRLKVPHGSRRRAGPSLPPRIALSIPTWNASSPSAYAPRPSR
jgi:pimeloyl-ACP methyl ester carboxylesterase